MVEKKSQPIYQVKRSLMTRSGKEQIVIKVIVDTNIIFSAFPNSPTANWKNRNSKCLQK